MQDQDLSKIKKLLLAVLVFIIYGTIGYMLLENLRFVDALLRVTLLSSTLGFSEATSQSDAGKLYTISLVICGVSVIVYATSMFVRSIIEGEVSGSWKRKMVENKLRKLNDHIILCGFGRVGRQIAEELKTEKADVVVIDKDDKSDECSKNGLIFIKGDISASDDTLAKAGVEKAKTLIIAFGRDSDCLAGAVTAKALNPDLYIVARASDKQAEERLTRVGVNRVAMPSYIGGYHMATMALRPSVVDFIDLVIDSKHKELQVEEFLIEPTSPLVGKDVHEYFRDKKSGVVLLAVQRKNGDGFVRPAGGTQVKEGDRLILMGTINQLESLIDRVMKKE